MEDQIERIAEVAASLTERLAEITEAHGAEAVALAAKVAQMQAMSDLVLIAPALAWIVGWVFIARKALDLVAKDDRGELPKGSDGKLMACIALSVVGGGASIVAVLVFLGRAFDAVLWASAFDPHFALAVKLMNAI